LALAVAALIILFGFNDEGEVASVFWDSIATVINAWMPSYEDGSIGYLILMSVTAVAGLLFTSVLIGIVTSAIEEKIIELKKGNSLVLESGHIVMLGFDPGEYTLLSQLILAAEDKPCRIVIAEDMDREEMEQHIKENLVLPKNVKIICRTADITSPQSIAKCSIETARMVIVNPGDDLTVTKAVLAVVALLKEKKADGVPINAILSQGDYRLPESLVKAHNISIFRTHDVMAKIIAHSCTQIGLCETFREAFNFEGSEFYLADIPEAAGETFGEVSVRLNHGVAVGISRDGDVTLNPAADEVIRQSDRILVFSTDSDDMKLEPPRDISQESDAPLPDADSDPGMEVMIIGRNESLPTVLRELPSNVTKAVLVGPEPPEEEKQKDAGAAAGRGLELVYSGLDPEDGDDAAEIAKDAEHIVILCDHELPEDEADMKTAFLLMNFRELRTIYGLSFNITVEMQKESNQKLVGIGSETDFLVTSSMGSTILAQLSENPELLGVFREILSNEGNEFYLKNAGSAGLCGTSSVRDLRRRMTAGGFVLLGFLNAERVSRFLLEPDEEITLTPDDDLIVIGAD
ncbi:MAG: hypothetical protein J5830_02590, partial [Clostridia bacterium]|nr:hypothetical protein [Clostridia bacterium]